MFLNHNPRITKPSRNRGIKYTKDIQEGEVRTKEGQQHYTAMRLPNGNHTLTIRASSPASGSLKPREKSRLEASASGSRDRMKETKDLTRRRVQTELKVETRNATAMRFFLLPLPTKRQTELSTRKQRTQEERKRHATVWMKTGVHGCKKAESG
jgi:hypothetical protein